MTLSNEDWRTTALFPVCMHSVKPDRAHYLLPSPAYLWLPFHGLCLVYCPILRLSVKRINIGLFNSLCDLVHIIEEYPREIILKVTLKLLLSVDHRLREDWALVIGEVLVQSVRPHQALIGLSQNIDCLRIKLRFQADDGQDEDESCEGEDPNVVVPRFRVTLIEIHLNGLFIRFLVELEARKHLFDLFHVYFSSFIVLLDGIGLSGLIRLIIFLPSLLVCTP